MTIPRELSLDENHRLIGHPCRELLEYLKGHAVGEEAQTGYIVKTLDFLMKSEYDIIVLEDKEKSEAIRFKMRHRDGTIHVFMERGGIYREVCTVQGAKMTLEILLDHYMAEVFLDEGRRMITEVNYHGGDCVLYQEV